MYLIHWLSDVKIYVYTCFILNVLGKIKRLDMIELLAKNCIAQMNIHNQEGKCVRKCFIFKNNIFKWVLEFKYDHTSTENDLRRGQKSASTPGIVKTPTRYWKTGNWE